MRRLAAGVGILLIRIQGFRDLLLSIAELLLEDSADVNADVEQEPVLRFHTPIKSRHVDGQVVWQVVRLLISA